MHKYVKSTNNLVNLFEQSLHNCDHCYKWPQNIIPPPISQVPSLFTPKWDTPSTLMWPEISCPGMREMNNYQMILEQKKTITCKDTLDCQHLQHLPKLTPFCFQDLGLNFRTQNLLTVCLKLGYCILKTFTQEVFFLETIFVAHFW